MFLTERKETGMDDFIYVWSVLYMLIIYACTTLISYNGFALYVAYFALALPFVKHLDKFAIICFLLSTIPDYFTGADAAVWSIYTIFAVIAFIKVLLSKRLVLKNVVPFIVLLLAVYLSYLTSPFQYSKGAFALAYSIVFALIIIFTVKLEEDTLVTYLPMLASMQIIMYVITIFSSGFFDGSILTISETINHNSFARSPAQLTTILTVKVLMKGRKNNYYVVIWIVAILMTLFSGSRNAFLALFVAIMFVYAYRQKKNGNLLGGFFKFGFALSIILLFAVLLLPESGFDISRYDYVSLFQKGGTNRIALWTALIPEIASQYLMFGYGPSHYCSTQIIAPLINRTYSHTHNTVIEAWGELGLVGLIPFIFILIGAYKSIKEKTNDNMSNLVVFAVFIELMVNSIGESFFTGINLWIVIGFCYCLNQKFKTKSVTTACDKLKTSTGGEFNG